MKLLDHQRMGSQYRLEFNNLYELLAEKARLSPDKVFIISEWEQEFRCTYRQFHEKVLGVVQELTESGVHSGDRISLLSHNTPDFLLLYYAIVSIGASVVTINPALAPREITFILKNSQAKALYYDESLEKKVSHIDNNLLQLVKRSFKRMAYFCSVRGDRFKQSEELQKKCLSIKSEQVAVIIYTSGTTGNPKGVLLTHFNLLADAQALSRWFEFSPDTRTLGILPLFHNNGQVVTFLSPLYAGGTTVLVPEKASLMSFWGVVDKHEANWTSVMPSILAILCSLQKERTDSSMCGIICGGQVLTASLKNQFEERFGITIFEGFGLTETTSFSTFSSYPADKRSDSSVGRPLEINEISIQDGQGNILSPGQDGEICIRGLNVASGYCALPEQTAFSFRGGWFHSGDYGYKDEDGYLYFRTRQDFLIIKGGENIYPAEVENVLFEHPQVKEAAVLGVKDDLMGQEICAFVDVADHSLITKKEILEFCRNRIGNFKVPKYLFILRDLDGLREIPKGPTKKVLYRELEHVFNDGLLKL